MEAASGPLVTDSLYGNWQSQRRLALSAPKLEYQSPVAAWAAVGAGVPSAHEGQMGDIPMKMPVPISVVG